MIQELHSALCTEEPGEVPPMTLWSCVLYVIANVIAWVLYWHYHHQRALRLQQEANGCVDGYADEASATYLSIYRRQYKKKTSSHSSLLSLLGLTYSGYSTFFAFEDRFVNFEDVAGACRKSGLESCNLIVGVDFSASNEWQGRKTFQGQNLHKVVNGKLLNPYQRVISIVGKTLESFDDDNLIPAYGFGDTTTAGRAVFCFSKGSGGEDVPCKGWTEVLERYHATASSITLSGPTNFAPIINKAVELVQQQKKYHILIIIADGQVTEQKDTVQAIVDASLYPLSIVMVGVGDGPWDVMETFDNCLPERHFDNFQFVNLHAVLRQYRKNPETGFALHALMEVPDQYKTIKSLGYLEGMEEGKSEAAATEANSPCNGTTGSGSPPDESHDQSPDPLARRSALTVRSLSGVVLATRALKRGKVK